MATSPPIRRHHHITLCSGGAQEDYDFHTKVLSLKSVKKTALYDGDVPIYHLYYGNDLGEESTLVTTFPMRQSGRKGRKGSGQVTILSLSVPVSSLGFWKKRLESHGRPTREAERFGEKILQFQHPCGIDYELCGIKDDPRKPYSNGVNNVKFTNNVWQRGKTGVCGIWGPIVSFVPNLPGNEWTNNVYDNGTTIRP